MGDYVSDGKKADSSKQISNKISMLEIRKKA